MSVALWLGVLVCGGLGAVGRFVLDAAVSARAFPFGTLAINLSGALALGLLNGLDVGGDLLLLAGTATLGAYTTFSTWMFETHRLAEDGEGVRAMANIVVSLVAGFAAAVLGHAIGASL